MRVACVAEDPRHLVVAELPEPECPPGGAILRVQGCGLCGSDVEKLDHRPVSPGTVLGHEVVGVLEAVDPRHGRFRVGDRVVVSHHVPCRRCHYCQRGSESMCRQFKATNLNPGGFSERIAVSAEHLALTTFHVPDAVPDAAAISVEPLACVLKAFRRALGSTDSGTLGIAGLGFIGLLAAQAAGRRGWEAMAWDVREDRLNWALDHDWLPPQNLYLADDPALRQSVAERTPTGGLDAVMLTVVTPASVRQALRLVRDGGTIILFAALHSSDHAQALPVDVLNPAELYYRELSLIPSYSPNLMDLRQAADWILYRDFPADPLVTHSVPLERLSEALGWARQGSAIKVMVQPNR